MPVARVPGHGGYDEELLPAGAEDINIMRRMAVLGKVVWFTREVKRGTEPHRARLLLDAHPTQGGECCQWVAVTFTASVVHLAPLLTLAQVGFWSS